MAELNFKRINKKAAHYGRARAVYNGKVTNDNLLGTLYLNYNEALKNYELYTKLDYSQKKACDSFVKEYNQERRLIADSTNVSFNANSFYADDATISLYDELFSQNKVRALTTVLSESVRAEIDQAFDKHHDVRELLEKYNYDPEKSASRAKKKNVYNTTFDDRKKIIELFLAMEYSKQSIVDNLNDHLSTRLNTDKQFTLSQIYMMVDPKSGYFAKAYLLGAMIDVIHSYGVNPAVELEIDIVFFYWYQIRLLQYSEPKALEKFIKEFRLEESSFLDVFEEMIYPPLVELMTREITDKYVGIIK